jgi:hypothetical protein
MANNIDTLRVLDRATTMLAGRMDEYRETYRQLTEATNCVRSLHEIVDYLNEISYVKNKTEQNEFAKKEIIANISKQKIRNDQNDDGRSIGVPGDHDIDGRGSYYTQQHANADQDAFHSAASAFSSGVPTVSSSNPYGTELPPFARYFDDVKRECDELKSINIIEFNSRMLFLIAKTEFNEFMIETRVSEADRKQMNELFDETLKTLVRTRYPEKPSSSKCSIC